MLYFEIIIKKKLKIVSKLIGILLIISSPIMMEQMGFVLQSIEIMVGFSLSAIGSILFVDYFEKKHKSSLVISIILIFITFSFYQAFVFLFISAVIMYLICKNKDQQGETQNIINDVIRSIFIFIIMFALYFILDKYVLSILDLDKTSYLTNQFLWGTESINVILKSTFKNLIKVYSGYYNCYHPFFTILSFVFIYDYSLKDKKDYVSYIPIEQIDTLICFGEISINKRTLSLLNKHNIVILFFNFYGQYIGRFTPKQYLDGKILINQIFQTLVLS